MSGENPFTRHLDACPQCRDHPFDLCAEGFRILINVRELVDAVSPIAVRFRYRRLGDHVHARLFTAIDDEHTFSLCGDLVFRAAEWPKVIELLLDRVDFISDDAGETVI